MAKKVIGQIKLQIPAGKANPSPPVGPALGQHGVNIMEFCKALTCRMPSRYRLLILIMIMIPFWTNSLIRTYAVRIIIGAKGIVNKLVLASGIIESPIRLMYTDTAVLLGLVYLMLPFMILPLYANIEKLDYRLVEASRDLGAGPYSTFRSVILPLTMPGILAGCIMVFVPTMGLFYVASLLGGAKSC